LITEQGQAVEVWAVQMSNKQVFRVSTGLKVMIQNSPTQLIELPSGEVLNKAHIVSIAIVEYSEVHDPLLQIAKQNGITIKKA